ncbi:hypothetical protein SLEP1_g21042 [Rubroshorea leprosula]|uniref:Uncharacterized protein n=1 Tax=Rubroshorea leprosula TaxID=152421 RepID=A0AAV5J4K0_9ROSI|nr:hypothetical protein SLEP1_g21042 [Rubroshorea leprosula]
MNPGVCWVLSEPKTNPARAWVPDEPSTTWVGSSWVHNEPKQALQALLQSIVDRNPSPPGFVVNPGQTHPSRTGFVENPGMSWVGPGFAKNPVRTWVRQEPKMNPPKPGFFTNP